MKEVWHALLGVMLAAGLAIALAVGIIKFDQRRKEGPRPKVEKTVSVQDVAEILLEKERDTVDYMVMGASGWDAVIDGAKKHNDFNRRISWGNIPVGGNEQLWAIWYRSGTNDIVEDYKNERNYILVRTKRGVTNYDGYLIVQDVNGTVYTGFEIALKLR